ncbi:hypothetical protein F5X96DRAFT_665737 [Biscogniauxia mediterranea]|nr:hypothetical protein F5X96DRAFT_665737 [Biscogniauxia mediterranea]
MSADLLTQDEEAPSSPSSPSPTPPPKTRQDILSSKTTMQTRKRRAQPAELNDEIAADDVKERKLNRASRWQIFLYHRRIPELDAPTIKEIYGDIAPESLEWANARQRFVDDQKNYKAHVLSYMETLLESHAQQPENKNLLDIEVSVSPARFREMAHSAWSPENFFQVWKYMRGYIDYEKSTDLGKYYMKHMFQGLAVEVASWMRESKADKGKGMARREELHKFYFAMPKKDQFASVSKECFAEIFEHQRNQKRSKKDEAAEEAAAHERFEINEEPPPPPTPSS